MQMRRRYNAVFTAKHGKENRATEGRAGSTIKGAQAQRSTIETYYSSNRGTGVYTGILPDISNKPSI